MKFICTVCGYIHEGDAAPERCPQCKVPASKFEVLKEDALRGDAFATYASYIVNIVCYRKDFSITIEQMDEIISGYNYPRVHAERLSCELRKLLDL